MSRALRKDFTYADLTRGIPARTVRELQRDKVLTAADAAMIIPPRTLERRLSANANLKLAEADALARLVRVVMAARDTFGKDDTADEFLRLPNPALGGRVPMELARSELGAREVEAVLGRIAHGVYS
ncbi:MAG: antitoxin Xre/MbcA/ParS toxin-binding domain-containing protein [Paracoccaceae bacterium]